MKGKLSIGFVDKYGDFGKVWLNGTTRKFETIEECKNYLEEHKEACKECKRIRIMQGWKVIEELNFIDSNILKDIKGEQNDNR